MSGMYLGAFGLLALAAVFVLFPGLFLRKRRVEDRKTTNRDWFLRREAEISGTGDTLDTGAGRPGSADPALQEELLQDARLRLLDEDEAEAREAGTGEPPRHALSRALLLAVLALVSGALYWQLGASPDVAIVRQLDGMGNEPSDADYRRLMLKVEDRVAQRPENLHYQAMLASFYMNEGDYGRAKETYLRLAEVAPNDAAAPALAAQAGFLAAGRKLNPEDQLLAERALSINPHQGTALGLLGMVAYENEDYRAAITYWRRLMAMMDPSSERAKMFSEVIARAEAQLAGTEVVGGSPHATSGQASSKPPSAAGSGPGITLRLELADGAQASPGDTVFVFARNPAVDSRMPVAVQRLTVSQLPLTLRLDDGNSMAGQKISELPLVEVVARVSPGGQPGEQFATFQASLSDLSPDPGEQVHTLVLRPVGDS